MGDIRKIRKKYKGPSHPWQKTRIDEEIELSKEYGTKSKEEIWKMISVLRRFANQSKKLVSLRTEQAEKEKIQLMKRLNSLGLLKETSGFDDILNLGIKDVMERRLQTIIHRKGLAKSMRQARQFIVHDHICIDGKKITSPSYLVRVGEEGKIGFSTGSPFFSSDHPERIIEEVVEAKKKKIIKETKEEKKEKVKKEEEPKKEKKPKQEKKKKAEKEKTK
ncbi:MAG: 30S ribosomal protein S4 [Nanoarchaeota archaeon]|nr:30S ribosomal protein S4 [Nanoarchaeota archaeon]